jgi:hypothetical protein
MLQVSWQRGDGIGVVNGNTITERGLVKLNIVDLTLDFGCGILIL